GKSSETTTSASGPSASSAARRVKPIPRPPTKTRAPDRSRSGAHASSAIASSEPCTRLDISGTPETRTTYASASRVSVIGAPSGVFASERSSRGFMAAEYGPLSSRIDAQRALGEHAHRAGVAGRVGHRGQPAQLAADGPAHRKRKDDLGAREHPGERDPHDAGLARFGVHDARRP